MKRSRFGLRSGWVSLGISDEQLMLELVKEGKARGCQVQGVVYSKTVLIVLGREMLKLLVFDLYCLVSASS